MSSRGRGQVAVVVGIGGMGRSIARRCAPGSRLLLLDRSVEALDEVEQALVGEGYDVTTRVLDIADAADVASSAEFAASLGDVSAVVHTAGLSGVQADPQQVLKVDLCGVAHVIESFGEVVAVGGAGVVIASMASQTIAPFSDEEAQELNATPAHRLTELASVRARLDRGEPAYSVAKLANLAQVRGGSVSWGRRGARLNCLSPGFIATPMGMAELAGEHGTAMRAMIETSNAKRVGTPADIAAAVDFLLGPCSSFISGIDLIVDGGVVAGLKSGVDVFAASA